MPSTVLPIASCTIAINNVVVVHPLITVSATATSAIATGRIQSVRCSPRSRTRPIRSGPLQPRTPSCFARRAPAIGKASQQGILPLVGECRPAARLRQRPTPSHSGRLGCSPKPDIGSCRGRQQFRTLPRADRRRSYRACRCVSRSCSNDQRRGCRRLTAIASAFFGPTRTSSCLARVTAV